MKTQEEQILAYLKSGKKLTAIDALNKFGCFRLSARVLDLKSNGHRIAKETIRTQTNKNVARYYYSN